MPDEELMNKEIVLALDLGGTNLRMAAVNNGGEILYRTKRATPTDEGASGIVQTITDLANECRQSVIRLKAISAIAAAVPGTVNVGKGIIMKAPTIPALDNFPLTEILGNELNLRCFLENDANAAAIGENWLGASKKFKIRFTLRSVRVSAAESLLKEKFCAALTERLLKSDTSALSRSAHRADAVAVVV